MFRWLKRIFQHDRSAVDFTKIDQHIEVQGEVTTPTVREHKPPVIDYDTMLMHRSMDTNFATYTMIPPQLMTAPVARKIIEAKKRDRYGHTNNVSGM